MSDRVIQVQVVAPSGNLDPKKRHWNLELFHADGTPYVPGESVSVPEGLVAEVDDHAARLAAIEAALAIEPPDPGPVTLTYAADGDANGLFYWIGTLGGTEAWQNPVSGPASRVVAEGSSVIPPHVPANAVDRGDAIFHTDDFPDGYLSFDLGTRRMRVTGYAMRARPDSSFQLPKNWKLQGSQDGDTWTDLRNHTGGDVYSQGGWHHWLDVVEATPWRFLRIFQTGLNVSDANYLSIGEIEFYGELTP